MPTGHTSSAGSATTVHHIHDWRTLLSRSFMEFHVDAAEPAAFRGSIRTRRIGGIEFIAMSTEGHVAHRGPDSIQAGERPDYLLCLQIEGVGEFTQSERTATVHPGDITLFDTTAPTSVLSSDNYRSLCVKFPQRLLDVPRERMSELTAVRLAATEGITPAAGAVLRTFDQIADSIPGRSRHLFAHNAIGIVSTLFQSQIHVTRLRRSSDIALEQMQDYIDAQLSDPDLTPARVAAAHFTSLRRVHTIFSAAGFTVAGWIHHRRLEQCRRDLLNPTMRSVPVAAIGLRWGFKTPSHFGKAFKATFGVTPGEYRSQASED
ncbi:helix-turn-helix domain-containing protein [Rhodococcus sp. NPDC127530]|uniref:AraC-like ligand-binding domain-containing protein n=1 Tax=unclassified Rhodococcus (in: high G+C Gram-positive bacteria) TaxID=192944 RepID=UPI0036405D84